MENGYLKLDHTFVNYLFKAQEEAERLGLKDISEIIFLKVLIDSDESFMYEFLNSTGVKWEKIEESMAKQLENYAKEENNGDDKVIFALQDEEITEQISLKNSFFQAMCNASYFMPDQCTICEESFILAMLSDNIPKHIISFFRKIKRDIICVTRYYQGLVFEVIADELLGQYYQLPEQETEDTSTVEIPFELSDCLTTMVSDNSAKSKILGRDEETQQLMKILLKAKKKNAILVGEPGVGKTAIVEHMVWLISNGKCPKELKNKKIISLDVNALIAGTKYRGEAEEKFKILAEFLKSRPDLILFVDEIHTMLGAGSTNNDSLDLANSLKPLLARENVSLIGCTTTNEYHEHFAKDGAFKRRFEVLKVKEPKYSEVYPMVKNQIESLKRIHKVKMETDVIDYIIMMASCFNAETCNPDRTLDLVDKAMATAKMKGQKCVSKETVISNFNANFKLYEKMSEEAKMATAYHEVGHYLIHKYSKNLKHQVLAVSIIPADSYLGITVAECSNEDFQSWNYDTCIDYIASCLAGRVAEKMYTNCNSTGASSDLHKATAEARKMLVEYGFSPTFSSRNFENDIDEKSMEKLNCEIDQLIEKGYNRAREIIKAHESTLIRISKELLKKGILIGNELEKLCKTEEECKTAIVIKS